MILGPLIYGYRFQIDSRIAELLMNLEQSVIIVEADESTIEPSRAFQRFGDINKFCLLELGWSLVFNLQHRK